MIYKAKAFAPASVANVAVGFDLLGFSIDVTGDTVLVERTKDREIKIDSIEGATLELPKDPKKNTATAGLIQFQKDLQLDFGFKVSIQKGISFGSGMGGSAASAVAAVVAANALIETPLPLAELIDYALIGEEQASGSYHADNVAPSLLGGLILSRVRKENSSFKTESTSIPIPKGIYCVLVHPEISVETKQARGILTPEISFSKHVSQSANLAGFIAGCFKNNIELIKKSFEDVIIEPQRAHLIRGFFNVKAAALANGALGCTISGAGPSVFAWAQSKSAADAILSAMLAAFKSEKQNATGWAVPLNNNGARLIE